MRFLNAFPYSLSCDEVVLKADNEVSIIAMVVKVNTTRSLCVTKLQTGGFYQQANSGSVARERTRYDFYQGQLSLVG